MGTNMLGHNLTYEELVANGWSVVKGKGVAMRRFTSLAFCLTRDGRRVKCVQGYGRTLQEALDDATSEANAWLEAERIVEFHRVPRQSPKRQRSRYPPH